MLRSLLKYDLRDSVFGGVRKRQMRDCRAGTPEEFARDVIKFKVGRAGPL